MPTDLGGSRKGQAFDLGALSDWLGGQRLGRARPDFLLTIGTPAGGKVSHGTYEALLK